MYTVFYKLLLRRRFFKFFHMSTIFGKCQHYHQWCTINYQQVTTLPSCLALPASIVVQSYQDVLVVSETVSVQLHCLPSGELLPPGFHHAPELQLRHIQSQHQLHRSQQLSHVPALGTTRSPGRDPSQPAGSAPQGATARPTPPPLSSALLEPTSGKTTTLPCHIPTSTWISQITLNVTYPGISQYKSL